MCIAVPVRIERIENDGINALVDYGGLKKKVSIILVKDRVKVNDYIIVHAGAAIEKIDQDEARERLALFKQLLEEK
ncbi:HypC/HybG/HupF family hydrogenase formation chaperone [Candidatus Bathyarchaeota archaeon]|nr:HypC/HybG/HupF family hydrogenase formation chaperone [Candidatus Bathyarchaeota archaeon]